MFKMSDQNQAHLENLSEIRNLMERSSRFISLSGLSGVFAGIIALIGAAVAFWYFDSSLYYPDYTSRIFTPDWQVRLDTVLFVLLDASIVLVLAIGVGIFFTTRRARKKGLNIWDPVAIRLMTNLAIPLVTGGIFILILVFKFHGVALAAPATLIFYGLGLINASKYTLNDIRYLGVSEIILGLIASFFAGYGLLFWAIGFGLLHIIYGTVMYYKYEA